MSEVEQYIEYIKAIRSDPEQRERMLRDLMLVGFEPNQACLSRLVSEHSRVHDTLFNHFIIVVLDVGGPVGHVYIEEMPLYSKEENIFKIQDKFGFNPKGANFLYTEGECKDETRRHAEGYSKISQMIELSKEQWEKLGRWAAEVKDNNPIYSAIAHIIPLDNIYHCAKFVDVALKTIGYVDGLKGVFSITDISEITKERFVAVLSQLLPSEQDLISSCLVDQESTYATCNHQAEEQIKILEKKRQIGKKKFIENTIQSFFDVANFFQTLFTELPEEMVDAAREGMIFGEMMQNNLNAMMGLPTQPASSLEEIDFTSRKLLLYSKLALDEAFKSSEQFNEPDKCKQNENHRYGYTMKPD